MKVIFISFILCIISCNFLFGNISSIENKYTYALFTNAQDTTVEEPLADISGTIQSGAQFKSPGKAMLYSAVLPGLGQAYMGKWTRGLIYLALEGVAAGAWYQNNILSEEKGKEYKLYASEHWDFGRWIKDYYQWFPDDAPTWYLEGDSLWNSIREVFVNKSDSLSGCHDPPYCYSDIWDHSHSVEFTWNGELVSSNDDEFTDVFNDLCGHNAHANKNCSKDLGEINNIIDENAVYVIKDHHFYEGIQKYDMYFAGWDDNTSAVVTDRGNNDKNVTSPHQIEYRSLWTDFNRIKSLASYAGKFMLINRLVSMVDGVLLAKKWNNKHNLQLSLNTYPDFRNKSGVGGLRLSILWK